jgi:RNA polymerase sigma factor (sigma-70 family)
VIPQLLSKQGRQSDVARRTAFADLHRDHAVAVYNLALRLVGDREDARDISQDVLLKAFERLGKPGDLHRRAWLYRVTVNACYDHLRTQKRRPRADADQIELVSPIDGYEQAALVRTVEEALRRLPPAQRAALLLREVHGLPTGEVAYALGTTADSAAVTLSRARKTFRRHFLEVEATDCGATPTATYKARRATTASAFALGLWLPRLHLPQAPLPAGLDSAALVSAASAGSTLSAAHGDAAVGFMARLAELLCTKVGTVGASATLITGSIGGAYAAEHAATHARHPIAASRQTATSGHTAAAAQAKTAAAPKPSATPKPKSTTVAAATPSATPSASAGSPTPTPTAVTVGETGDTGTPTPMPSATVEPTATPTPSATPEPTATPTPEPTATPAPTPSASVTPEPSASPSF